MLGLSLGVRFLVFIIGMGLGFLLLLKPLQIIQLTGKVEWAERHMGQGGSYGFIQLAGVFLMLVGVILLFKG